MKSTNQFSIIFLSSFLYFLFQFKTHSRIGLVGLTGFEPAASASRTQRSTKLSHNPKPFTLYHFLLTKAKEQKRKFLNFDFVLYKNRIFWYNQFMYKNDTIAAISTALQVAAIGIVRVSGCDSFNIVNKFFKPNNKDEKFLPNMLIYGKFCVGNFTDNCMCVKFLAPKSYTGEDMAEFHCHGGVEVVKGILNAIINSGLNVRLAENGEFTRRAFINGKFDLSRAEGVIEMITAESQAELIAASRLADGGLYNETVKFQNELTDIISNLEVLIDYPDEKVELNDLNKRLREIYANLQNLNDTYSVGKVLKDGINLVICGASNVGKSSLINALLNFDRAIVTEIAGTTRDTIEERLEINGVKFNIVDTAGFRESDNVIEKIGISRSKSAIKNADIILYVIEPQKVNEDKELLKQFKNKKVITVLNKIDLKIKCDKRSDIEISAKYNKNIDKLKDLIFKTANINNIFDNLVIISLRHYNALLKAALRLGNLIENLNTLTLDIIAFEIKGVWDILGEITGTTATEEIINNIFEKFCLGK